MEIAMLKPRVLAAALALALLAAACDQSPPPAAQAPAASSEASGAASAPAGKAYRDTLNIAMTAQPPSLDPEMTVSAVGLDIAANIFESLVTLNANYEPVPMLAESVEISEDRLSYVFRLREGITFHNGDKLTAEDAAASMSRWLRLASRARTLMGGAAFEAIGEDAVRLTLAEPASDTLLVLAAHSQFPAIMPKSVAEAAGDAGIAQFIGTGPYKFVEWRQDQYILLERNESYKSVDSDPSGLSGRKSAPTPKLVYHFVQDPQTRVSGLKAGTYDVADSLPTEDYAPLSEDPAVHLYRKNSGAMTAFFNTRGGLLENPALRQAVLAAMNDDDIMLASYADPSIYSLNPGYLNPQQTSWATDAGKELYNQKNPEKAGELMKEAGYDGSTLTILATPDYSEMFNASVVLQSQLTEAGFAAEISSYDFPTFMERKNDYAVWDVFIANTVYQLTPPQLLAMGSEFAGFNDPKAAAMIKEIRSAPSQEEAVKAWARLQAFMYETGSSSVIGHYTSLVGTGAKVEGFNAFIAPVVWNATVEK
jgi:peptide/nickel transport system substrate-binding protein